MFLYLKHIPAIGAVFVHMAASLDNKLREGVPKLDFISHWQPHGIEKLKMKFLSPDSARQRQMGHITFDTDGGKQ